MNWALVAGSLAAVLMLTGIAWALGLGGPARIECEAHAIRLAEDGIAGFEARDAVICDQGGTAVVFGIDGDLALIRPRGARFVVHRVRQPHWRVSGDTLEIDSGDGDRIALELDAGTGRGC